MAIKPKSPNAALRNAVSGKVVVVTGAASGIGFALTRLLAENNATVIMVDRNAEALDAASKNVTGRLYSYECDISSWEQQRALFEVIIERFFRLDILCCNAGIDPELLCLNAEKGALASRQVCYNWLADEKTADAQDQSNASWPSWAQGPARPHPGAEGLKKPPTHVFDVNLQGTIYGIKLALHHMSKFDAHRHRTTGEAPEARHIIVTGSAAAYEGFPGQDLYSASKHALLGLVRAVSRRSEVEQAGISVSMVCPWLTSTPLVADIASSHKEGAKASTPEDVAAAFGQILSWSRDESNGRVLAVHGEKVVGVERTV